jgi:acyl carrier protein
MEVKARERLLGILEESGLYVEQKSSGEDLDLREYIVDSVQFMSFVVEIESQFNIEMPDEALAYERFASLNGLATIIESIISGGMYVSRDGGNGT